MKHAPDLEMALYLAPAVSRYLEDKRLDGEEWIVSVWLQGGRFTVWLHINCRVQGNLKQISKIIDPRVPIDFAYSIVDEAIYELRA